MSDPVKVAIIGSGPAGLLAGATLARRGHRVTSVDRDPGPNPDGAWPRRGVMQFAHAHNFRPQVSWLLQAQWPEAFRVWRSLGVEPLDQRSTRPIACVYCLRKR